MNFCKAAPKLRCGISFLQLPNTHANISSTSNAFQNKPHSSSWMQRSYLSSDHTWFSTVCCTLIRKRSTPHLQSPFNLNLKVWCREKSHYCIKRLLQSLWEWLQTLMRLTPAFQWTTSKIRNNFHSHVSSEVHCFWEQSPYCIMDAQQSDFWTDSDSIEEDFCFRSKRKKRFEFCVYELFVLVTVYVRSPTLVLDFLWFAILPLRTGLHQIERNSTLIYVMWDSQRNSHKSFCGGFKIIMSLQRTFGLTQRLSYTWSKVPIKFVNENNRLISWRKKTVLTVFVNQTWTLKQCHGQHLRARLIKFTEQSYSGCILQW